MPFSPATLERGIFRLEEANLITRKRIFRDPRTKSRLQGPRNLYRNRFNALASKAMSPTEFADALEGDS
jgi:hypothetical protein